MQNRNCIEINFNKSSKPALNSKVLVANSSSDDSDDGSNDDDNNNNNYKSKVNKELMLIHDDASKIIEEQVKNNDPLIYDYDEAYDDIIREKEKSNNYKHQSKDPKYMKALIASSQRSKLETIMMKEKVLRGKLKRENGNENVPVFVTKKYKEALDNLKARNSIEESDEKNTINNKDFGMMGFYSHLLTKNTLYSKTEDHPIEKDTNSKDIAEIYSQRKKEYERHLSHINTHSIKTNFNKPIEISIDTDNHNSITTSDNNLVEKKEEYLSRYLQRKKNRETSDQ